MTAEEIQNIADIVLERVKKESWDVQTLPLVDTVEGVNSLPAMRGSDPVRVPLAVLVNSDVAELAEKILADAVKRIDAVEAEAKDAALEAREAAEYARNFSDNIPILTKEEIDETTK